MLSVYESQAIYDQILKQDVLSGYQQAASNRAQTVDINKQLLQMNNYGKRTSGSNQGVLGSIDPTSNKYLTFNDWLAGAGSLNPFAKDKKAMDRSRQLLGGQSSDGLDTPLGY